MKHTYIHTYTKTGTRQTQPASFLLFITTTPGRRKHIHTHTHGTSAAAKDKWEQQLVETATQKEDTKKVSGIWQQRRRRRRHFLVSAYTRWKIGVHSIKHKKECKGKSNNKACKKKRDLFEIKRANNKKRKTEKNWFLCFGNTSDISFTQSVKLKQCERASRRWDKPPNKVQVRWQYQKCSVRHKRQK